MRSTRDPYLDDFQALADELTAARRREALFHVVAIVFTLSTAAATASGLTLLLTWGV